MDKLSSRVLDRTFIFYVMIKIRYINVFRRTFFEFSNKKKNYYEILNSSEDASQEQIKRNYYSLVKKYHPDVSKTNQEDIKILNQAYAVLSNEKERKKYDIELGLVNRQTIKPEKKSQKNEYEPKEHIYKPHRPYYDEQKQMFKSKLRSRPQSPFQMLFQNFIFGMLMTGVLLLVFGFPSSNQKANNRQLQPKKYGKQQFERDFQASLMKRPSNQ